MTDSQKKAIRQFREAGLGDKAISANTGMSVGAIRAFINVNFLLIIPQVA